MRNGQWCPLSRFSDVLGDRWSLQILRELSVRPQRFKLLKENIAGISMDQLSRKLESLCAAFLVVRQEFSESPPRVEYELTDKGKSFVPVLKRLLNWSTENLWSEPHTNEEVDVGLSLRTMASFFGSGSGSALIHLVFSRGVEFWRVERFESGRVDISQGDSEPTEKVDVRLEVSMVEWIRIISTASQGNKIQVRGYIAGKKAVLTRIFPIFSFVKWIDEDRPISSFGEAVTDQLPVPRMSIKTQIATPIKTR